MDTTKAQKLLLKIQAFLDHGPSQELSRLEKDLMKSYVIQLYEAVTDQSTSAVQETKSSRTESRVVVEVPPVHVPEPPKIEIPPVFTPEFKVPKHVEVPVEIKQPEKETIVVAPIAEAKPLQIPVVEPVKETLSPRVMISEPVSTGGEEGLEKLFDLPRSEDMSGRSTHVPIASIESALGLNARIFTLNELFGGDRVLFDATCQQLNELSSFGEAKNLLMEGAARKFKWADQERIKMAEDFIRIVARRYPKS